MKFKKNILTIMIMQLVSSILCSPAFAVYPGTFDFNNETAYILEVPEKGDRVIRYINFKDNEEKIIKSGFFLREPAINHGRKIISFISKKTINFYDIEKGIIFFTVPKISGSKITWNDSGNKISYYDSSSNVIMEVDIKKMEIIKIPFNGYVFQAEWNSKSNGFLYQLRNKGGSEGGSHLGAKIMKNIDGKLQEYKGVKILTMSPHGDYYYEGISYPEEGNIVSFYKVGGDELIISYESASPLFNADVIWGVNTVRFLFEGGTFDFKQGKFITYADNFWPVNDFISGSQQKVNPRRDMAADWNNYVLMWNKGTKMFEVEDINTGKIIKTYKKFW